VSLFLLRIRISTIAVATTARAMTSSVVMEGMGADVPGPEPVAIEIAADELAVIPFSVAVT
jgi:hypothetical protein